MLIDLTTEQIIVLRGLTYDAIRAANDVRQIDALDDVATVLEECAEYGVDTERELAGQ